MANQRIFVIHKPIYGSIVQDIPNQSIDRKE